MNSLTDLREVVDVVIGVDTHSAAVIDDDSDRRVVVGELHQLYIALGGRLDGDLVEDTTSRSIAMPKARPAARSNAALPAKSPATSTAYWKTRHQLLDEA